MAISENIVTQIEDPQFAAKKIAAIDKAKELIEKDINLAAPTATGQDAQTIQAQNLAQTGLGSFQPFLQTGSNFLTGAGQQAALGNQIAGGIAGNYVPAQQEAMQGTALGAQLGQQASVAGMQGIQNQLSANNPYLTGAVGNVNQAATDAQNQALYAQGMLGGSAGQYDPNSAQAFMNPYEDAVVQRTLADMQRASDISGQGDAAAAVGAGAFGGSRSGIVASERGRNLLDQQAKAAGGIRQQGYNQAIQQSMAAQEAALQRQQKAAGLMGQLGQAGAATGLQAGSSTGQLGQQATQQALQAGQIGGQLGAQYGQMGLAGQEAAAKLGLAGADLTGKAAGQIGDLAAQRAQLGQSAVGQAYDSAQTMAGLGQTAAGLGQLGQQMQYTDVDALTKLGGQKQVMDQAALDQKYNYDLQQEMRPYQKLGFYSDILQGAPSNQMSINQTTAPSPSMLNQVVGAGISGLGIANAAQNVGVI